VTDILRVEIVDRKVPNWWTRPVAIANSPITLTIFGIALTAVVGILITGRLSDDQHRADQETQALKDRETVWNEREAAIIGTMANRLADARLVAAALGEDSTNDEIDQRWKRYEETSRNYMAASGQNDVALRIFAGANLNPDSLLDGLSGNTFTKFKDIITSRLTLLDDCVTLHHLGYVTRTAKAAAVTVWNGKPFECSLETHERAARWFSVLSDSTSRCLISYEIELSDVMRLKRMLAHARIVAETDPRRILPWSSSDSETVRAIGKIATDNYVGINDRLNRACALPKAPPAKTAPPPGAPVGVEKPG
jgi:ABC-type multidrug transport system fused ATPase/permease subunit